MITARAAAIPEMTFARLGSNEGLSQGAIRAISQDSQGFMWFGTEEGLDRFDGYELKHFIHKRGDAGSPPNTWIVAFASDADGRLWAGSDGGGVFWRDLRHGVFQAWRSDAASTADPLAQVRALHVDRKGLLWVATRNAGLHVIDKLGHQHAQYRHDAQQSHSLSDDSVFAVTEDSSGRLLIGTAAGLDRVDPVAGSIDHLATADVVANGSKQVNTLFIDAHGTLWIGMDSALVEMDLSTGKLTALRHRPDDPTSLPEGRITALLEDDEQRMWVGTTNGLALLDRRNNHCFVMRHEPTSEDSLPDSSITSLFQDRGGLLWIGTKRGGVARWNPRSWSFGHHRFGQETADSITSFAEGTGKLWVGSFGAGAAAIDLLTGAVQRYRQGSTGPLALRDDTIMALLADDRGRIWLGTMSHGVERLDPARRKITHFDSVAGDSRSLPAAGVMSLLQDRRGRVWVGTYGGGLAMIDPESDRVVRFEHGRADEGGLSGDRATALAEDRAGLIWIGTDGGGLNVLDPASRRFAHFRRDPRDTLSLGSDVVYAVHADEKGGMWIGTRGGGLDHAVGKPFAPHGLQFLNLSEGEGLPNSTVYGIESDSTAHLWISTNLGLAQVAIDTGAVRAFHRNHGLQGEEFNFGAHLRGSDGTVYFGGNNGYNAFVPERLQYTTKAPPIALTGVFKANTSVSNSPESLQDLQLSFRDPMVTFQFAALDYAGSANNHYNYRLDGYDTDWVDAGSSRSATYTHLNGGDYTFRVRAANSDGVWSETPLAVGLHVAPAPWASWWARSIYCIALLALLLLVRAALHRRRRREVAYTRRLQHEVESRTRELAERNQEMASVNQQLREASTTDSLTGLGNRRFLHEAMDAIAEKSESHAQTCVFMVIDLDHLKPINDRYGHEGGDAVLLQVTEILRREFRAGDLIVRWGGDEFVAVCMNIDLVAAAALAEAVRSSVAKRLFRVGNGQVARTACSIGFATAPFVPGMRLLWQQSLNIADLALYEAKHDRNTWIGWSGTARTAGLSTLMADLAASPAALELEGYLQACRRPLNPDETVDRLRAPRLPAP